MLHASSVTSCDIIISTCPAELRDCQCPAPLRHFHNSLSRFSLFYNTFLPTDHNNLQQIGSRIYQNVYENVVYIYSFGRYFY